METNETYDSECPQASEQLPTKFDAGQISESLCETCRSVDFDKALHKPTHYSKIWINTWKQLYETTCPLCRLVRKALLFNLYPRPPENDAQQVFLTSETIWKSCIAYNQYQFGGDSNEYDLKAHAERTRTASRCQLRVYPSSGYPGGECQIRPLLPGPFSGRRVDQDHANLELVREWLDICNTHHMGSCNLNNTSRMAFPKHFRLIDVTRDKIVSELPGPKPRYIALTYVWGENKMGFEMPRTLKAAVHTDDTGVEVIDLPTFLPRTVRDALEVTRSLGFTYLWVDSLCIIQDDEEDRQSQINMMDEIYKNASLTVAAGSSPHADWGLPGISIPRLKSQQMERIGQREFAVAFPSLKGIDSNFGDRINLVWNTRGWTLQEKVLSKRLLLFTDFQMYFRCNNSVFAEDVSMETGALSNHTGKTTNPLQFGSFKYEQPKIWTRIFEGFLRDKYIKDERPSFPHISTYFNLIGEYTARRFTFQGDSINAISGVLRVLDPSDLAFCAGLPRKWLLENLLWQPRPRSRYSINYDATAGIPSWSWAAWSLDQGCNLPNSVLAFGLLREYSWMTIYYKDSKGRVLWEFEDWTSKTPKNLPQMSWTELSATARRYLDTSGIILGFQTCIGAFRIGRAVNESIGTDVPEDELYEYYLMDEAGRHVGKISTCARVAQKPSAHEFIALLTKKTGDWAVSDAVDEIYQPKKLTPWKKVTYTGRSYTRNGEAIGEICGGVVLPEENWRVTDVMLVEWKDDIALRIAVGHVISTAFEWRPNRIVYLG